MTRVWPFETGFTLAPAPATGPSTLLAEIWPGVLEQEGRLSVPRGAVRDQVQVREMCRWAATLDGLGKLAILFDTPPDLTPGQEAACLTEEGWILGAPSGIRRPMPG